MSTGPNFLYTQGLDRPILRLGEKPMGRKLTPEEIIQLREFLQSPRIGVLATVNRNGSPQISPIWYRYSDGKITMSTIEETLKCRNVRRDPRASLCVYSVPDGLEYATLSGTVTVTDGDAIWEETQAIVALYELPERAQERMTRLRSQNRVIIVLVPEKIDFSKSEGRRSSRIEN